MMGAKTLASLVGSVDNLHEAVPLANKTETVLGVIISLQILSWGCGLLRLWTRLRVIRSPGWDDLFVFLSMVRNSLFLPLPGRLGAGGLTSGFSNRSRQAWGRLPYALVSLI